MRPTSHYRRAIEEAAERIAEWVPKGVHFGWEKSFKKTRASSRRR